MIKKLKKNIYNYIIPLIGQMFVDSKRIPVIYYHDVVEDNHGYSFMHTEISVFKEQMKHLKEKGYKTYTFAEIPEGFKKEPNSREVIITFDDGFLSNYTIVFPILKKYGLKFNIFLTPVYLEDRNNDYLNWEMVKEMSKSELVGFGAHTYTHIDSRNINETNYYKEIELTNKLIKECTQEEVNDFCFPYGYYNESIMKLLSENRIYKRLYTADYMNLRTINECEVIGRIPISNDYSLKTFEQHLQGYYNIMYNYIICKRYLSRKGNTGGFKIGNN